MRLSKITLKSNADIEDKLKAHEQIFAKDGQAKHVTITPLFGARVWTITWPEDQAV